MRTPRFLAASLLLVAVTAAPSAAQPVESEMAVGPWSYAGPTGPRFWARLGYPDCAGPRQSPINLPPTPWTFRGVQVDYAPNPGRLSNNGHTVTLLLTDSTTLTVADTAFAFREVHFHVPAEHTVRGQRHAAEIHTVNQLGHGNRAVLTTFVREGAHNPAWNTLIDSLPGNKGDLRVIGRVNLTELLSLQNLSTERMYTYPGSLTTPSCEPNVRFLIRERTIMLSRAQIDELASAMPRNVRPVQVSPSRSGPR
jgi:carbonic anhydrase